MKKIIILIFLFGISELSAQLNIGGEPLSSENRIKKVLPQKIPTEYLPSINLTKIQLQDVEEEKKGMPPRFGFPIDVNLNLENSGVWTKVDSGHIWQLSIKAEGAKSINLLYDDFWLPKGATLYIYNAKKTHVIGGFTEANNKGIKEDFTKFATGLVYGDKITLEYFEPDTVTGQGEISIENVVHGYRKIDISNSLKAFGTSQSCQINVNCDEGDDWQFEKRGVALIVIDGTRWCSGALLNTSNGFATPYFLTADHCLNGEDAIGDPDASNWSFYWNYESPNCTNPSQEPEIFSTTGAVVVANRQSTDFALMRLTESPTLYGVTFLGWTATTSTFPGGVGIHHPDGDVKKISIENDNVNVFDGSISWTDGVTTPANTHWRVVFDDGGTEGGSSGSPLMDNNGRVVGQLHGGTGLCPGDSGFRKFYGILGVSFNGNNEHRRLRDWIYPTCNSNVTITEDFNGETPTQLSSDYLTANNELGSQTFVVYKAGDFVRLTPGFRAYVGADMTAKIGACNNSESNALGNTIALNSYTNTEEQLVENKSSSNQNKDKQQFQVEQNTVSIIPTNDFIIYPNPSQGESVIKFELTQDANATISIFNSQGKLVFEWSDDFIVGQNEVELRDLKKLSAGVYHVRLQTPEMTLSKSLILQKF